VYCLQEIKIYSSGIGHEGIENTIIQPRPGTYDRKRVYGLCLFSRWGSNNRSKYSVNGPEGM